jgi:uncharacterized protein YjiS (DUF1127 family)
MTVRDGQESAAEKMSANSTAYTNRMTLSDRARRIASFLTKLPTTTIPVWIERSRQRRALAELADRDGHLLADIGLSLERARREAGKPFWVFSRRGDAMPSDTATMTAFAGRDLRCHGRRMAAWPSQPNVLRPLGKMARP